MNESIIKAAQGAELLVSDIRQAHKTAIYENPLLEIVLRDLLNDAIATSRRISEIEAAITAATN